MMSHVKLLLSALQQELLNCHSSIMFRPRQGRVKGNQVICPCLPLPYTYLIMMALTYLYFHLAGPHPPLHFTPLTGNSHFNGYNIFYLLITLYHTTYYVFYSKFHLATFSVCACFKESKEMAKSTLHRSRGRVA
jgi:hypothetical protein